jgi:uncharacterized membrane protein YcaP (DUF421 family)
MDVVIRTLVIFLFLWLAIRISGRREVAQLSAFDMILLVTVGDLVAQGVVQEDYSLTTALVAVSTMTLAGLGLAWADFRFPAARPVIAGVPRIVMRDGEPVLEVLHSERLTIEDVQEACRQQGIRRLSEVELCVLETNGSFSFFTNEGNSDEHEGAPETGKVS